MDDKRILELFAKRNEDAVHQVESKYGAYCATVAQHILLLGEDVEECLNDTWLHAWNSIPPQKPLSLKHYLAKLTRNLAFNRYKHERTQKRGGGTLCAVLDELENCLPSGQTAESQAELNELGESIRAYLKTLPLRERDIFLRRYFYAEQTSEIATRYALQESHVSMILQRTRSKLKKHLEKEGYQP